MVNYPGHSKYIISQTAIIHYLHIHKNVGVKIGWIYKASNYPMAYSTIAAALKKWDELKFDRYDKEICSDKLEFLYCRAGIEKLNKGNIQEACPYIAYSKDSRYILGYLPYAAVKLALKLNGLSSYGISIAGNQYNNLIL
ncbi:MAG TPA: hypothetical protein LFV92_02950 [Rickettsia endosymbiont of Ceroptres masudai]|nr:hypothetical protein [Rickettsia endosymbiont of Ceroptres masudai]